MNRSVRVKIDLIRIAAAALHVLSPDIEQLNASNTEPILELREGDIYYNELLTRLRGGVPEMIMLGDAMDRHRCSIETCCLSFSRLFEKRGHLITRIKVTEVDVSSLTFFELKLIKVHILARGGSLPQEKRRPDDHRADEDCECDFQGMWVKRLTLLLSGAPAVAAKPKQNLNRRVH